MKKLSVFFLLLVHMNYFMFLPQVPETDAYDSNGQQTDDINSVAEWISATLGFDQTSDDEDDDSGNNFLLAKCCEATVHQQPVSIEQAPCFCITRKKTAFPEFQDNHFPSIYIEVASPPPDSRA